MYPQLYVPPKRAWETIFSDELVDEVLRFRESYSGKFEYDVDRICNDLRRRGGFNPAPVAEVSPKPAAKRLGA